MDEEVSAIKIAIFASGQGTNAKADHPVFP